MKECLLCPIKGCGYAINFENTPKTAILEYINVYNDFEKHLMAKHSLNQLIHALYHLAILTQFEDVKASDVVKKR